MKTQEIRDRWHGKTIKFIPKSNGMNVLNKALSDLQWTLNRIDELEAACKLALEHLEFSGRRGDIQNVLRVTLGAEKNIRSLDSLEAPSYTDKTGDSDFVNKVID